MEKRSDSPRRWASWNQMLCLVPRRRRTLRPAISLVGIEFAKDLDTFASSINDFYGRYDETVSTGCLPIKIDGAQASFHQRCADLHR
ncbi:hypothetical protein ACNKHM_17710 [Shigella sonnei]